MSSQIDVYVWYDDPLVSTAIRSLSSTAADLHYSGQINQDNIPGEFDEQISHVLMIGGVR